MKYATYRKYVDRKVNSLPIVYAITFSRDKDEQNRVFREAMAKLGLWDDQINLVKGNRYTGAIWKKKDQPLIDYVWHERKALCKYLMDTDDEFFLDAMKYELRNHEYMISGDSTDTLRSLYTSWDEIKADERKRRLHRQAKYEVMKAWYKSEYEAEDFIKTAEANCYH